jgi:DNA polymerase III delta subunit
MLVKYISNPNDSSKLILVSDKYDTKLNVYKAIVSGSFVLETRDMKYQRDLIRWLENYLSEKQLGMEKRAMELFTSIVEPNAYLAFNEMQKLEIYIGTARMITHQDVRECTVSSKLYTIFDLIDAIGNRNKSHSLHISENMISNNESLIMIIVMLTNFFITLLRLKSLQNKGISIMELKVEHMKDINNKYIRDKYIVYLSNYDRKKMLKALKQLYICDSRAKLTMASDVVLLTELVCGII